MTAKMARDGFAGRSRFGFLHVCALLSTKTAFVADDGHWEIPGQLDMSLWWTGNSMKLFRALDNQVFSQGSGSNWIISALNELRLSFQQALHNLTQHLYFSIKLVQIWKEPSWIHSWSNGRIFLKSAINCDHEGHFRSTRCKNSQNPKMRSTGGTILHHFSCHIHNFWPIMFKVCLNLVR